MAARSPRRLIGSSSPTKSATKADVAVFVPAGTKNKRVTHGPGIAELAGRQVRELGSIEALDHI
jgi:hypothetical protein